MSCSADRHLKARIDRDGVWIEALEHDPARFLPAGSAAGLDTGRDVAIDLDRPMGALLAELSRYPVTTPLRLTGTLIVARDEAHACLKERLLRGDELPRYFRDHPIYYAGPAKTAAGLPSGSFGPTTAGRRDVYVDLFSPSAAR